MSGTAGERLARLLALVPWLIAHDGVTMAECATHFGVSEEQLEQDLWLVVVCGVPGYGPDQLVDIDFWDDGVIHVLDPQTLARPLRLTHEEAVTLLVALRMLAQLPGIDDREAVLSAAAKIERMANEAASARFVTVDVGVADEVTAAIDTALAEGRELEITYAAATRDEVSERTVQPLRILAVDGVGYLEAHCLSAGALRTFRLNRILVARAGAPIGAAESAPRIARAGEAAPRTATISVEPEARWIIDVHAGAELVSEDTAGRAVIRLPLHSLDWAVRLVLSLAGSAVALDPPELRAAVADTAAAALASYP
jgi:proteasome accessory factor C